MQTHTLRATSATEVVDLGDSLIHGVHILRVPLDAGKPLAVNRITAFNLIWQDVWNRKAQNIFQHLSNPMPLFLFWASQLPRFICMSAWRNSFASGMSLRHTHVSGNVWCFELQTNQVIQWWSMGSKHAQETLGIGMAVMCVCQGWWVWLTDRSIGIGFNWCVDWLGDSTDSGGWLRLLKLAFNLPERRCATGTPRTRPVSKDPVT